MKKCPYCVEEIQDEAVKCRHCGQSLVSPRVRELSSRWASITQFERDEEWANLDSQQQRELTLALDEQATRRPPPAPTRLVELPTKRKTSPAAWGCLILIVLGVALGLPSSNQR